MSKKTSKISNKSLKRSCKKKSKTRKTKKQSGSGKLQYGTQNQTTYEQAYSPQQVSEIFKFITNHQSNYYSKHLIKALLSDPGVQNYIKSRSMFDSTNKLYLDAANVLKNQQELFL